MSISVDPKRESLMVGNIEAPLALRPEEDLPLRVFVDKNLVEVFANDRQAAVFAHKHIRELPNLRLFATGGDVTVVSASVWNVNTIYGDAAD